MENKEKIVIKLNELPLRAEKLSPDEVISVFGGCRDLGESCSCAPCCDGTCQNLPEIGSFCTR